MASIEGAHSLGSVKEGWRGDLFRSDLARVLAQLPDEAVIPRPFHDTITVFYAEDGAWVDDRQPVRLRAYGDLPDLTPQAVAAFLQHRLRGKIQVKQSLRTVVGGEVYIESRNQDQSRAFPYLPRYLLVGERVYTPIVPASPGESIMRPGRCWAGRRKRSSFTGLPSMSSATCTGSPITTSPSTSATSALGSRSRRPTPSKLPASGKRSRSTGSRGHFRSAHSSCSSKTCCAARSASARESSFPEVEGKLEVVDSASGEDRLHDALLE